MVVSGVITLRLIIDNSAGKCDFARHTSNTNTKSIRCLFYTMCAIGVGIDGDLEIFLAFRGF